MPTIPAVPPSLSIKWTTYTEEIALKGWDEFAEKLKVELKKDGSASFQRIQIFNALGAKGWEVVEQQANTSTTTLAADRGAFGRVGDNVNRTATTGTLLFKKRVQ
jgi:hypothetical protein